MWLLSRLRRRLPRSLATRLDEAALRLLLACLRHDYVDHPVLAFAYELTRTPTGLYRLEFTASDAQHGTALRHHVIEHSSPRVIAHQLNDALGGLG